MAVKEMFREATKTLHCVVADKDSAVIVLLAAV